ncbi:MAG TPA: helix-turn-helix domain-containing protein [Marinagarivorans sp.]
MLEDLAGRLGRWRQLWGFSQRELARRADITNSTLSQIEQGNTSPSVQTLQKIADAFGISLQALMFSEPCAPVLVKTESAAPIVPLQAGTVGVYNFDGVAPAFFRIHLKPNGILEHTELLRVLGKSVGALLAELPRGCSKGPIEASSSDWARLYIVAGELTVTVTGQSKTLWVGDSACLPLYQRHTLACTGRATAELLLIPRVAVSR